MPWDAQTFQHHNHHLGIVHAAHAAEVANAILRRTGNEGLAIATANAREPHNGYGGIIRHRDSGGGVDPASIGGVAPSNNTMNPITQGMIQRYSSYPVEKLQELAGMLGASPQGQIVQKVLAQRRAMPYAQTSARPAQQPTPISPIPQQTARHGGTIRRAQGGDMGISPSQGDPWWTRQQAAQNDRPSGFLAGTTGGRTDAVHTAAPAGSYVLPADVIAGLGEGNSLAGAKVWDTILRSGPWGTPQLQGRSGHSIPQPPRPAAAQAKGGDVQGGSEGAPTPVALSHGEVVVFPEDVKMFARHFGGTDDLKYGHRILDEFVMMERKRQIAKLKSLPPPVGAKKKAA